MKKLLLSIAVLAGAATMMAESNTITFDPKQDGFSYKGSENSQGTAIQPLEEFTVQGYTFTFGQDGQTKPAIYYSNNSLRLYINGTMTVTGGLVGKATNVTINYSSIAGIDDNNLPTVEGYTCTLSTDSKTITYKATTAPATFALVMPTEKGADGKNPNFQFTSIVFSDEEGGSGGDDPNPGKLVLLSSNANGWTLEANNLPEGLTYVWKWDDSYNYLKGSAYVGGAKTVSDCYAISPVITLSEGANMNFEEAANYKTTLEKLCGVSIREYGSDTWTALTVPNWPAGGNWTFINSGNIDLSAYAGKNVEIGFKYGSSADEGADTWEIKNLTINGGKINNNPAGITAIEDDANAPVVYYNLQGIKVANPANGIFIKVQGKKATKVYFGK